MSKRRISKKWLIPLIVILVLVAIRISLPYVILKYANKVLSEMDTYRGHIEDVDLQIYRGAYQVDGITIKKIASNVEKPFLDIEKIELAIEWPALLEGKIVGEVELIKPIVNFVGGSSEENNQTGVENDWTEPIKKLLPLKINKFEIKNGKIFYYDFTSSPNVELHINDLNLVATNLSNASDSTSRLPSSMKISGTSIGNGILDINGKMNLLKKIPDLDINLKFTSVALKSLNDFTKAYGKFDFEKGSMSLFSEVALADGNIEGYIKPILTDVKILDIDEKNESVFKKVWEGILEVTEEVLQNQKEDQSATRTPISGNISNLKTAFMPTLLNVLKNAFIEAFSKQVDQDISFEDAASGGSKDDKKSEKEKRKEERKEKREEKKEEKKKKKEEDKK